MAVSSSFWSRPVLASLIIFAPACGSGNGTASSPADTSSTQLFSAMPLNDNAQGNYLVFTGGLYPDGSNEPPAQHRSAALARANAIKPLDLNGKPSSGGKIVLLSIGMSNTTQEFCSGSSELPCNPWTFMGQAAADPMANHSTLALVNGAMGGRSAEFWESPTAPDYDRIRDTRLTPQGLSERQVQAVWLKVADAGPTVSLPSTQADAFVLETRIGNILRALKTRYPNLQIVFASSRIYAGYATTMLNPEPFAYESGLSVKWVIQAQIEQIQNGGVVTDQRARDLNYNSVAPLVVWAAYLWANDNHPRSDGLVWVQADFQSDGTHPSQSGQQKVGTLLLNFFKTSPFTKCWFVNGGTCP